MTYLNIEALNYKYPGESGLALKNINIDLNRGEILLVMGSSGSGKSTLLKCISGSIPNFYGGTISGVLNVKGKELKDMDHQERAREITMVFQDPERQLLMNKVHREVAFGLENIGTPETVIKRRVMEALQFSNLMEIAQRDIDTLSGGQKQRVAIASAISYLPGCIILDEPTSQLDPSAAEEVVDLVKKINNELGTTIIVSEQRIGKWFEAADKIALMDKGEIVFYGNKKDYYKSQEEYLNRFLPLTMKLSKHIGMKEMPESLREIRACLEGYKYIAAAKEPETGGEAIISIKNMSASYDREEVLRNVNFEVGKGEFWGILGANGAGKSTLFKALTGFLKYSGSIRINDKEIKKYKDREISKLIGYVSQNPNDYISKDTVFDELKFTLDNFGMKDDGLIENTLKSLQIYELKDKNPRDLSGGERQRVAIASVLVLQPPILLLDEPTRGLDTEAKKLLGALLGDMNRKGATILMITHDMDFACDYCNNIALFFNGELAGKGTRDKALREGIYYTTDINKLLREIDENIYTLHQVTNSLGRV